MDLLVEVIFFNKINILIDNGFGNTRY